MQTIDTYKLTSMEEPSDEILAQIMHEAAVDAKKKVKQHISATSTNSERWQVRLFRNGFAQVLIWLWCNDY